MNRAANILIMGAAGIGLVFAGILIGRSTFGPVSGTASLLSNFHLLAEVPRRASATSSKPAVARTVALRGTHTPLSAASSSPRAAAVVASTTVSATGTIYATRILPPTSTPIVSECHFATDEFPSYKHLVISEVAWMGTPEDSGSEWIELRNASDTPIDVANYWVIDKAEQIKAHLPAKNVSPGGFYILERGDDALPSTTADFVYTGGLANSNEGLRVFDQGCHLVDQVIADPKWPAGNSSARRSMERGGDWLWYTYVGSATNTIFGTPGFQNSAPQSPIGQFFDPPRPSTTQSLAETHTATSTTSTLAAVPEEATTTAVASAADTFFDEPSSTPADSTGAVSLLDHLVISAVQTTGGPGKTTEDFVEIFNPTNSSVNLKGIRLVKRTKVGATDTSIKSWTSDTFIASQAYYVWANTSYSGVKTADVRTSGSIADDNAVALRQGSEDTGLIIDAVGWGQASNALVEDSPFGTNPIAGQLLTRKQWVDTNNNANDFELR